MDQTRFCSGRLGKRGINVHEVMFMGYCPDILKIKSFRKAIISPLQL